ncbi:anti-sigma factor family protein [Streptomyces flaveolus]|uniref:anti-sigma factor family protein n=1 Tax=Streptomyces flaveolus TaxID=67297 RepID=UPI0016704634|nr:zf-HC2 domain-containing protein [Streptomyces flaveolus]GGQ51629.1 membrane protein [Streptomyces flaveolus]
MSGSRPEPEGHLAEQHLGDRLSALVDGELGHDARERVLAHVATCPKCKAEVDAQRRLKNVFAAAAPPAPSESFLARLQGLPGGGDGDGHGSPLSGGRFSDPMPGMPGKFEFGYVPARPHSSLLASSSADRGFRIHDVSRHESERTASRGMRFAFVAAGAVSLAAIALGGVTLGTPDTTTEARGSGAGSNVTPLGTQGAGAAKSPESQRRRSAGPLLGQAQGQRTLGEAPVAPTEVSAPLLPGLPAPAGSDPRQQAVRALTKPVTVGAVAVSPLIRPLDAVPPLALAAWPSPPVVEPPGLFTAPAPDPLSSPRASALPAVPHRPAP